MAQTPSPCAERSRIGSFSRAHRIVVAANEPGGREITECVAVEPVRPVLLRDSGDELAIDGWGIEG